MRKLDFALQTILLGITVLVVVAALLIDKGQIFWAGMLQFLIGCEQLLSGLITVVKTKHNNSYRTRGIRIYWLLVLIYFSVLAVLYGSGSDEIAFAWFFSAWGIAVYYYVFTIKLAFGKTVERTTFLDIAN